MFKKKLLFVIPTFEIGGTNKTLENYLSILDKDKYDIMIYCLQCKTSNYYTALFHQYFVKRSIIAYFCIDNVITRKIYNLIKKKNANIDKLLRKHEASYLENKIIPDVVIAFQEQEVTNFCKYFFNTRKIAWVHSFWPYFSNNSYKYLYLEDYTEYDNIVCVSNALKDFFNSCFPELKEKCISIYNPLNTNKILEQSLVTIEEELFLENVFTIISVGHLVDVKQFHLIPHIVRKILDNECKKPFIWYIVGAEFRADYKKDIIKEIEKYNVGNYIKLIGERDNPYPYIAKSDLLVCTSKSESFSYVINEAKVLEVPVISNNFPVATEVVEESTGCICNIETMDKIIFELIENHEGKYTKLKENIKGHIYKNSQILFNLYKLIDNII